MLSEKLRAALANLLPDVGEDEAYLSDGVSALRDAAELIAFTDRPEPGVILTQRTETLSKHPGQVAFPGGRLDPGEDALTAALREANEEVGVRAEEVDVLGVLPEALVAVTGYRVTSVVGWWRTPRPLTAVDTVEVAAVHSVAVDDLVAPRNRWTWRLSPEHSGPAFRVRDLFVWGLTGDLLSGLLNVAGWEEPWDRRREAAVPQRFFRHPGRS